MEKDLGNKYSKEDTLLFEYETYNTSAPLVAPILHEKLGIMGNFKSPYNLFFFLC